MVRFLKPGGALFLVVTDETVGYTGLVLNSFIEQGGDTGDNARHLSDIAERRRLLGMPAEGGGAIIEMLLAPPVLQRTLRCNASRAGSMGITWPI